MSGFGHYGRTIAELEHEIACRCILIGLDWSDGAQMRAFASEALHCPAGQRVDMLHAPDVQTKAKANLFALSILMFDIMRQSAQSGERIEGSGICRAFSNAFDTTYSNGSGRSGA